MASGAEFNFVRQDDDEGNYVRQFTSLYYQLIWQTETEPDSGVFAPVPMVGYTAKMDVRKGPGKPLIISLTTENNRINLDPASGLVTLQISNVDTGPLPPGVYQYDLHLISPDGFVTTLIAGLFEIVGGITQ